MPREALITAMRMIRRAFYVLFAGYLLCRAVWLVWMSARWGVSPSGDALTMAAFCALSAYADVLLRWSRESREEEGRA
jgi:hypothetical protein